MLQTACNMCTSTWVQNTTNPFKKDSLACLLMYTYGNERGGHSRMQCYSAAHVFESSSRFDVFLGLFEAGNLAVWLVFLTYSL